jgi:hypothetical protein
VADSPQDDPWPVYERIIPDAYHGTDKASAESILKGQFKVGRNSELFLGDGAYFFEGCIHRAWEWAVSHKKIPPAVLRATISLGRCLDFTKMAHAKKLKDYYEATITRMSSSPQLRAQLRRFTPTVAINLLAKELGVDTVRSDFHRQGYLLEGALIPSDSRITVCVRNVDKILSVTLDNPPD